MAKNNPRAFSLIELSIVILIIGIMITGLTQSSRLIREFKLSAARRITDNSSVAAIKDLRLWLEPSSINAFATVEGIGEAQDGDDVDVWYDSNPQATFKRNFTAYSSSHRPVYEENGINDLPTLVFTHASNDHMINTDGFLDAGDSTYTIFTVSKPVTTGDNYFIVSQGLSNSGSNGAIFSLLYLNNGNGPGLAVYNYSYLPTSFVIDDPYITAVVADGTAIDLYNNSKTPSSGTVAANYGPGGTHGVIGGPPYATVATTQGMEGEISEVIAFDRVLKVSEIYEILDYLSKKYSIRLS